MINDSTVPDDSYPQGAESNDDVVATPPASRDADTNDVPPPVSIAGKGPMDQSVPDVASGSTPVTRHDD